MVDKSPDDVVQITHLLNRIASTADVSENLDDYMALFTDDVVFEFAAVPAVGLEEVTYSGLPEVRAGAESRRAAGVQGPGSSTLHIISDVTIDFSSDDEATAHAAWQYLGKRDGAPALVGMGIYRNWLRRVDGTWLLSRRVVTVY